MSFDIIFIGEVNEGKTTIVSSLIEDENAPISPEDDTTKNAKCYRFDAQDGTTILRAWDTPGFVRTDDLHAWFVENTHKKASMRIASFILEHESLDGWERDIALLKPISRGALVVYVVASNRKPQVSSDKKQLEIIRLAGANRIALINLRPGQDYTADWNELLKEEVGITHTYSPLSARIEERLNLLAKLADCSEENRTSVMLAHDRLKVDWDERVSDLARLMLKTVAKAVTLKTTDETKKGANEKLTEELRSLEEEFRSDAKRLFKHKRLNFDTEFFNFPITNSEYWKSHKLGMTRKNASLYGGVGGAVIGAIIDGGTGGAGFGIPTASCATVGAAGAQLFAFFPITYEKFGDSHFSAKLQRKSQAINVLLDRMLAFSKCLLQVSHGMRLDEAIHLELPSGDDAVMHKNGYTDNWDVLTMRAWWILQKFMRKGKVEKNQRCPAGGHFGRGRHREHAGRQYGGGCIRLRRHPGSLHSGLA